MDRLGIDNKPLITCLKGALSLKSMSAVVTNIYVPLGSTSNSVLPSNTTAPENLSAQALLRREVCHRTSEAAPRSRVACEKHVGLPLDRADQ
jgi:hypothetical protein